MVHAAEWTAAQRCKYLRDESKGSYYQLTKMCGYGVLILERALSCASNFLSLIAQASIRPFDKNEEGRYVSKDMHIYQLPWPVDVLRDLGEFGLRMRVTVSYFVEPSPGEVGWKERYRYASHGLRFALNGPGQSYEEFVKHVNNKAREEEGYQTTEGASGHWQIGESRNVGSIHSDTWSGTAAEFALSSLIAVHPAVGWWRERHHLGKHNKETRYSLIVSFTLPCLLYTSDAADE
mgnify:CR=1 FL=1